MLWPVRSLDRNRLPIKTTEKEEISVKKTKRKALTSRVSLVGVLFTMGVSLASPAWAASFTMNTGAPDGKIGALSRRPSPGKIETETADDFNLQQTTVIKSATIAGLIPTGIPLTNIFNVEVEVYHVFPLDSDTSRIIKVPSRTNSPSDVEIASATRDGSAGTLSFVATAVASNFTATNTVVNGTLNLAPSFTGQEVEITITFTSPIVLPAGNYFLRPEVEVINGDFLYLSAPRPIVSPGTPFATDRQAWIRNSNLAPDWLRIGTDIVGGATPPTFNMTFSLTGETVPEAGTPGQAICHDQTLSALAHQFGGILSASSALGFSSVHALQDAFRAYCEP
jgi:hypothetical protein